MNIPVGEVNPFHRETLECPYSYYEALRREAPVFEAAPGVFFISTHEHVTKVLWDTENFSSKNKAAFLNFQGDAGLAAPSRPPPHLEEILKQGVPDRDTLLSADPPQHTHYRILVNRALAPKRIARYEPIIREVTTRLIDAFIDRGEVEFVSEFSAELPLHAVTIALGIPRGDTAKYKDWAVRSTATLSRQLTPEELIDSTRAGVDLSNYLAARVEEARVHPEDTIIGLLVSAHLLDSGEDGHEELRPLDTPEIVSILRQLLVAGQETVNYLAASLMKMLVEEPEKCRAIQAAPEKVKALVEEGVRIESPIQRLGRVAKNDVEVGGVLIPAGSRIVILYGCANRDASVFSHPDELDVDRPDLRSHLGFGAGTHFCAGAPLARLEARVAFEEILRRMGNFRFTPGRNSFTHYHTFIFRGLEALHLQFDKLA